MTPTNPTSSAKQRSMPRILIVDDERTILDLLLDIFHDEGFKVYTARNGEDAYALLAHQAVDIVLTDFMMPQLSGIELARRIRANPATAAIPIMLMSAATPKDQDASISMIIAKPFRIEDLIEKVKRFSFE